MNKLVHRLLLLVVLSLLAGPVAAQSTLTPANGWWWTKQVPDSGTRYALQFSSDLSSLYGVAATFRDDGSPVWYAINANNAADANTGSGNAAPPSGATSAGAAGSSGTKASGTGSAGWTFSGSASEYAGGGGVADGPESNSSGLQAIVADVDLSFPPLPSRSTRASSLIRSTIATARRARRRPMAQTTCSRRWFAIFWWASRPVLWIVKPAPPRV